MDLKSQFHGNGQIKQDFAAVSYPQGSRISLTANAGKGATFSGWEGDALGAENQITILMDAPKAVTANFTLPISNWETKNFTAAELLDPAISGDDTDPDGDGLRNWQEYLHSSDPKNAASKGIISLKVEGN